MIPYQLVMGEPVYAQIDPFTTGGAILICGLVALCPVFGLMFNGLKHWSMKLAHKRAVMNENRFLSSYVSGAMSSKPKSSAAECEANGGDHIEKETEIMKNCVVNSSTSAEFPSTSSSEEDRDNKSMLENRTHRPSNSTEQ